MNNSVKNRVNSCGNKQEVPFEAICTSAEWIREDVQAVAEVFSLNSERLLKAVLDQFGSGAVLTRGRKARGPRNRRGAARFQPTPTGGSKRRLPRRSRPGNRIY